MKLYSDNTLQTDGVDQKDVSQFTIKANGKAFHMLIAGLYSQKIDSVVREVCSNAYDSHNAAGKVNTPFDVTLPTHLEPVFSVRDFGTGLPVDKLIKLFTTIFESTKEDSNNDIGAFGLGSKSPYAITDQFVIESNYNGVRSTFLAYKDGQGVPSMMATGEEATTDGNGITVRIPVKPNDIYQVQAALKRQLYFFPHKPSINGQVNDAFWHKQQSRKLLGKATYLEKTPAWQGQRVKMGPVSYPLDLNELDETVREKLKSLLGYNEQGQCVITELPMGAVDLQPSREGLSYIPQTKDALNKYFNEMLDEYDQAIQDEFALHQSNLMESLEWVMKTTQDQPYTKTITFTTKKGVNISELLSSKKLHSLVKYEAVKQTEKHKQLTVDNGVEAIKEVEQEVNRVPFLGQSVSPHNKKIAKTNPALQLLGYSNIQNLIKDEVLYVFADTQDRVSNRVRHFIDQKRKTVMLVVPNREVHDKTKISVDAFAAEIAKVTGDLNGVLNKIVSAASLPLPPAAPKAPRGPKVQGELGSVYTVSKTSLNARKINHIDDVPEDAAYIITERGQLTNSKLMDLIKNAVGDHLTVVACSKSDTGSLKKLIANGNKPLDQFLYERSEAWRYRVFIAKNYDNIKSHGKVMNLPDFLQNMKTPSLDAYRELRRKVAKEAEFYKERTKGLDGVVALFNHFEGGEKNVHEMRCSTKAVRHLKDLNNLKRMSKKIADHPLMMLVSSIDHWTLQRMDGATKAKVLAFCTDTFTI